MLRLVIASLIVATLSPSISAAEPNRTRAAVKFSSCTKPEWPKEALRNEQTGKVTLGFLIGTDGVVKDSKIVTSSGYPLLDEAAREGIRKCRFIPGTIDGVAQEGWQMMQYIWTLEPNPSPQGQRVPEPG